MSAWRQRLKQKLKQHSKKLNEEPNEKSDFNIEANKYSGYVYDAVWLYALALDKLVKQDQSYIQDIHSNRSVNAFVDIIHSMDFNGVSGRINFVHSNSRLSNVQVHTSK